MNYLFAVFYGVLSVVGEGLRDVCEPGCGSLSQLKSSSVKGIVAVVDVDGEGLLVSKPATAFSLILGCD